MWTNIPQVEGSQTFQSKAELTNTVWLYRNSQLFRFKSSQNQKKPVTLRFMSLKLLLWLRIPVKSSIKPRFSSWLVEFQRTFLSLQQEHHLSAFLDEILSLIGEIMSS